MEEKNKLIFLAIFLATFFAMFGETIPMSFQSQFIGSLGGSLGMFTMSGVLAVALIDWVFYASGIHAGVLSST